MSASSPEVLRDVRPVFAVNGSDRGELALGLLRLAIHEDSDGLCRCEATFGNWGSVGDSTSFLYFGRDVLEFGKDFVVRFGSDRLFEGRILGLEAGFPEGVPPEITVLADDRLQDLRMTRRTRSWESSTDADVLQAIANDHGLTPQIDLSGPTYAVLTQVNQSDLAFARERVRASGGELWLEGRTLHAKARTARATTNAPELGHGRNLLAFTITADLAHQRTTVTATGWDVGGKQAIKHDATDSVLGSEVNGGDSGPSILNSALGTRKETLVHRVPLTTSEAEHAANSHFRTIARRFVVGHGIADGDVAIRVGRKIDITGIGPLFSGTYVVTQTRHTFDSTRGYRTTFSVERPALSRN